MNFDDYFTEEWNHSADILNCVTLPSSIVRSFYFIICELIKNYPKMKVEFINNKYEIIAKYVEEEENKEMKIEDCFEADFSLNKITNIHVYIDFYLISDESTMVQFIKGDEMSYLSYKMFFTEFLRDLKELKDEEDK